MKGMLEVALAAFLHDWGKLLQRGCVPLSEQANRMKEMLCPMPRGYHSHLHVLWTNDFLENHAPWIPSELDHARISRLASRHHRPSDAEDFLISEADRLASGHDRRPATEAERENFRRVPMLSIFNRLALRERGTTASAWHRPTRVHFDDRFLPLSSDDKGGIVESDFELTAKEFIDYSESLKHAGLPRCCDVAANLSETFLASVPASTIDVADVSLHDHSSLVAAFATALFSYHRETTSLDESSITNRTAPKFRLVTGDLSGIQKYLFDMPDEGRKGIARTYRARSFYLSMLTHAATLLLIDQLGLTRFSRVIDAGGRFILLVPNLPEAVSTIANLGRQMEAWLLKKHAGAITLNLSISDALSGGDFMGDRFLDTFEQAKRDAEITKSRKLGSTLIDENGWCESSQCLGYVHTRQVGKAATEIDMQTGRRLPETHFVGLWNGEAPIGLLDNPLDILGLNLQLFEDVPLPFRDSATDLFSIQATTKTGGEVLSRPLANYVPRFERDDIQRLNHMLSPRFVDDSAGDEREAGRLITFTDLANLARTEVNGSFRGQPAIACLKADVDRLGMLFSHGFGDHGSFGRVATLSRRLDLFFKGFLEEKLADAASPYRFVYTIFAGGDDLLLVGPWYIMFSLAVDLRRWFSDLTGGNPDVTISAGLALGHGRMPISLLAGSAEKALERAKQADRNRVSAFDSVFGWGEFSEAIESGRRLDRLLIQGDQKGSLPIRPAFVYRLLQYAKMAEKVRSARDNEALAAAGQSLSPRSVRLGDLRGELTWRSHLQYDLRRNIVDRAKNVSDDARQDLEWLQSLLCIDPKPRDTQKLKLAATYALYRNRGG